MQKSEYATLNYINAFSCISVLFLMFHVIEQLYGWGLETEGDMMQFIFAFAIFILPLITIIILVVFLLKRSDKLKTLNRCDLIIISMPVFNILMALFFLFWGLMHDYPPIV